MRNISLALLLALAAAGPASASRVPLQAARAIAQICQVAADGGCAPLAIVPAEFHHDGFRAEWNPGPGVDRAASFRARVSAFGAPLGTTTFTIPPRRGSDDDQDAEVKIHIPAVAIADFWVLKASGGSAEVGRAGSGLALRDGTASLVVPAGALASRATITISKDATAPASAGLVSGAFSFSPAATTFAVPATVTIAYDPARLPAGVAESALRVVRLLNGLYLALPDSSVDTTLHTVSAPSSALGTFAASAPVVTTQVVGAGGGTVQAPGGITLILPSFATDSSQPITITQTADPAPANVPQLSPVYRFGPEGLVFAQPVTVSIPFTGDPTHARLYWTRLGSTEYENIGGKVVGDQLVGTVTHFSSGVVGVGPAVRTVSGTQINTWLTATTSVNVADDLSAPGSVEALVPDGTGGFTSIPGVGTPTGTFAIAGVPDGLYYLRTLRSYQVTSSSAPDLGGYRLGRPDVVAADPAMLDTTKLVFNLGNLSPWQATDYMELFSFSANAFVFGVQDYVSTPFVSGDPSLNGATITERGFDDAGSANLIDGSKGDTLTLLQLSTRPSLINGQPTGPSYQSVNRIYSTTAVTQANGTTTTIGNFPTAADAFTDVSADNPITADVRTSQFLPVLAGLNPSFTATNPDCNFGEPALLTVDIQVEPATGVAAGTLLAQFSGLPDVLLFRTPLAGPDVVTGTMFYGVPLPGSVNAFGTIDIFCNVPLLVPGATSPRYLRAGYREDRAIAALLAGPVVPQLSAPQNIKVNGLDYFQAQTGIGASPTLSWTAPAIGTPAVYSLGVHRFWMNPSNQTQRSRVASLQTAGTSITLPNLLTVDPALPTPQYFAFSLSANSNANPNLADAPNRGLLPDANAQTASALMAP